jgi:hypothetical protein
MAGIWAEVAASHAPVDRVYELEKDLPAYEAALDANSPSARFAADRLRACTRFTASLYLTAWRDSQSIRFPEWHKREATANVETRNPKSEGKAKSE